MKRTLAFALVALFVVLIGALALVALLPLGRKQRATPKGIPVAPQCEAYYQLYGGAAFFGPPLAPPTPMDAEGRRVRQIFANAELICEADGQAQPIPLGSMFVPSDPAPPPDPDPLFRDWVEAHGGLRVFGRPLTGLRYNPNRRRWEQHFANLGAAWQVNGHTPYPVPYGVIAHPELGPGAGPTAWQTSPLGDFPAPFYPFLRQIGGIPFLGSPLSKPYLNWYTRTYEVVFTKAVLGMNLDDAQMSVALQPVVSTYHLGVSTPPVPRDPSPLLLFWETSAQGKAGLGYNIPLVFVEFLNAHGGIPVLCGEPISERRMAADGLYEQWCRNIGLVYNPQTHQVGLRPVGQRFMQEVYPRVSAFPQPVADAPQLRMYLPKRARFGGPLTITTIALDAAGNPAAGQRVILLPPDGFPPQALRTDAYGVARFELPLNVPSLLGTQIFRACLWLGPGKANCTAASVLIAP